MSVLRSSANRRLATARLFPMIARRGGSMLDIEFIRGHADEVKRAVTRKRFDVDIDRLLALDAERRAAIAEVDGLRQKRNELSAKIPKLAAGERPAAVE